MTRIIVDESTQAKLTRLLQPADLCAANGQVLGQFIPALHPTLLQAMQPQISEEELQRREQDEGGRSLADILADLEKRS